MYYQFLPFLAKNFNTQSFLFSKNAKKRGKIKFLFFRTANVVCPKNVEIVDHWSKNFFKIEKEALVNFSIFELNFFPRLKGSKWKIRAWNSLKNFRNFGQKSLCTKIFIFNQWSQIYNSKFFIDLVHCVLKFLGPLWGIQFCGEGWGFGGLKTAARSGIGDTDQMKFFSWACWPLQVIMIHSDLLFAFLFSYRVIWSKIEWPRLCTF